MQLLEKLRAKGTDAERILADQAEQGINVLQSQRIPIGYPSSAIIQDAYRTIRALHLKGHGWRTWENSADGPAEITPGTSMRTYVKSWVTRWDSLRLYPGEECEIEVSPWNSPYIDEENIREEDSDEKKQTSISGCTPPESSTGLISEGTEELITSGIPVAPAPSAPFPPSTQ